MQLVSTLAELTARAAQRLQACIHIVELALHELDRIGFSLKAVYTARVHTTPTYGYNLPYHEAA